MSNAIDIKYLSSSPKPLGVFWALHPGKWLVRDDFSNWGSKEHNETVWLQHTPPNKFPNCSETKTWAWIVISPWRKLAYKECMNCISKAFMALHYHCPKAFLSAFPIFSSQDHRIVEQEHKTKILQCEVAQAGLLQEITQMCQVLCRCAQHSGKPSSCSQICCFWASGGVFSPSRMPPFPGWGSTSGQREMPIIFCTIWICSQMTLLGFFTFLLQSNRGWTLTW